MPDGGFRISYLEVQIDLESHLEHHRRQDLAMALQHFEKSKQKSCVKRKVFLYS